MAKKEVKKTKVVNTKKESYLKGVSKELRKVTWPSLRTMVKYTVATILFCLFFALFFYGLDAFFALIKGWLN